MFDVMAQTRVIFDLKFREFWDKPNSIVLVSDIWSYKDKKRMDREAESSKPVQKPWKADAEAETWSLPGNLSYTSAQGGPTKSGPTMSLVNWVRNKPGDLGHLFLSFLRSKL